MTENEMIYISPHIHYMYIYIHTCIHVSTAYKFCGRNYFNNNYYAKKSLELLPYLQIFIENIKYNEISEKN